MANGRHGLGDSNNEQSSGKQEHNESIGLGVHLNNYTDHSDIQGDATGNAANAGVGSTTSFAGVAVAVEGWLAVMFEICNITDSDEYRLG
jgi:hypothetical protein